MGDGRQKTEDRKRRIVQMELNRAQDIASIVRSKLASYCEKIEIAGSVRRLKKEVKDIDLVATPKAVMVKDLFGEQALHYTELDLYPWGELGIVIKNGPRYKQIALTEGIRLDLFIVMPPAQWGMIFVIKTGPADFSRWIVTKQCYGGAMPDDYLVLDGCVYRGEQRDLIPMRTEADFFAFLGLEMVLPSKRKARWRSSWK